MGSSSSRLGGCSRRRPSRFRAHRRSRAIAPPAHSSLASASSSPTFPLPEVEHHSANVLETSVGPRRTTSGHCCLNLVESSVILTSADSATSRNERGTPLQAGNGTIETLAVDYGSRNFESKDKEAWVSETKETLIPYQDFATDGLAKCDFKRSCDIASTSTEPQPQNSKSVKEKCNTCASLQDDCAKVLTVSDLCADALCERNFPLPDHSRSFSFVNCVSPLRNSIDGSVGAQTSDSTSEPVGCSSLSWEFEREDSIQERQNSDSSIPLEQREQRNRTALHVDILSISSGTVSSAAHEVYNREARRTSRRLIWDAFSRHSSRRPSTSTTIVPPAEENDEPVTQDRWTLGFGGDLLDNGSDFRYPSNRGDRASERWWRPRPEVRPSEKNENNEPNGVSMYCASGLHEDGTCSCESFLMEDTGTRASISRIVMLAEALFEVLDEIHRQPGPLSLSVVSVPAPETLVDSLPVKIHHKTYQNKQDEDMEQCYICLSEYEEGDKVRVLPCCHEYHMMCIDKWLKEIHRVCPLCRGDVCASGSECSISNSSIP
ncbi:E3 ubiquitin-protein ligase [Nymphaea thermarum]|nr:E3 ubiquitin-protein ligase [Nymphaea thermarum]